MKINIPEVIENSIEWEQVSEAIKKSFEEYLDKFFREHKGSADVPLAFKEWLNLAIGNKEGI